MLSTLSTLPVTVILNLAVAVRGGGHNVAGRSTIEGRMMIDLSPMTGIHVDPKRRTARAQGGLTWNLFNRETQIHGLATTGGVVSTTGIGGLTLGGRTRLAHGKARTASNPCTVAMRLKVADSSGQKIRSSVRAHSESQPTALGPEKPSCRWVLLTSNRPCGHIYPRSGKIGWTSYCLQ
jgi:hypothetical protein